MHDGYRCSCGTLYESLDSAGECPSCGPEPVTICDGCGKGYFDSDRTQECEESHALDKT